MTNVNEALPAYQRRVLFYKPGPEAGWGKDWLVGHRAGTNAEGEYWKSESHSGVLYGITYWQELPPLPTAL